MLSIKTTIKNVIKIKMLINCRVKAFGFPLGLCVLASVLDSVRQLVAVGTDRAALVQTADVLMAYGSLLEELSDLLTSAEDTVDRAKGLNLKSQVALRHLEVTLTVTGITFFNLRFILVIFPHISNEVTTLFFSPFLAGET